MEYTELNILSPELLWLKKREIGIESQNMLLPEITKDRKMHVMLGGKFECAVIRAVDEQNSVQRNDRISGYYGGLNRRTPQSFLDRATMFITLAEEVLIAGADWSDSSSDDSESGVSGADLGIRHEHGQFNEWDNCHKSLARYVLDHGLLTDDLTAYISDIHLSELANTDGISRQTEYEKGKYGIAQHYLCRLFLQIRSVQGTDIALVLDESDIDIIKQINRHAIEGRLVPPFELPDTGGTIIRGHSFGGPLLSFSAPDARAIAAIRASSEVQEYVKSIRKIIKESGSDTEVALIRAMSENYQYVKRKSDVTKFFEISGWIAKPINYIPVVGNITSIISDAVDVAQIAINRNITSRNWYLISAKATQVGIEDYLRRQHNRS